MVTMAGQGAAVSAHAALDGRVGDPVRRDAAAILRPARISSSCRTMRTFTSCGGRERVFLVERGKKSRDESRLSRLGSLRYEHVNPVMLAVSETSHANSHSLYDAL